MFGLDQTRISPWSPDTIVFLDVSERTDILPLRAIYNSGLGPSQRITILWTVLLVNSEIEQRISCVVGMC